MSSNNVSVGAKMTLDGESDFRKAVSSITKEYSVLRSEMKLCEAEFKNNEDSVESLIKKQEILKKEHETQSQKIDLLKAALENAKKEYGENSDKANDWQIKLYNAQATLKNLDEELNQNKTKLEEAEKGTDDTTHSIEGLDDKMSVLRSEMKLCEAEYKNNAASAEALKAKQQILNEEYSTQEERVSVLAAALQSAKEQYGENSREANDWQIKLYNAQATLKNLDEELNQNKAKLEEAEKGTDDTTNAVEELDGELQDGTKSTQVFGDVLKANLVSEVLVDSIKLLANGIKNIGEDAISVGSSFEKAMSEVSAISGAMGEDLEALTEKAEEMGATTKFSATESAEAFTYMAMAGWKTEDMLSGIEGIMNLAAASGEDLATTSDIVTDALTAFGLAAEDSGHFADILAAASSNANTNVSMMGETFKYCAPIAGALGFSAEDTAEAIGLMANAGIKSSQAGTALRMIMNNLSGDLTVYGENIGEVTVQTTNADGSMRELNDILEDCRSAFSGLSASEKASNAQTIAGTNAMSGFLALMNAAPADIQKLSNAIEDCDGAAADMAETMNDNLDGSLTILDSTLEGVGITIYDKFENTFKNAVDTAIDSMSELNSEMKYGELGDSLDSLAASLDEAASSMIECAVDALPELINGMVFLLDNGEVITATAFGGAAAWGAYELAVNGAEIAQKALNLAQSINPTGLLIAGIAGVTVGLGAYVKKATEAENITDDIADAGEKWSKQAEELVATVKETTDAYDTNSKSIEVDRQANLALAKQLEELTDKEELTNEEQLLMQNTINQLNEAIPGLSLYWDGNTAALNRNNKEIEDMIENYSAYLQVQAAQELLYDLTKQQLEVQLQLNDANEEFEKLTKNSEEKLAAYSEVANEFSLNFIGHTKEVNTAEAAWEQASEAVMEQNIAISDLNNTYESNQQKIDELTEYINENANAFSYETDMLADEIKAYEASQNAVEELKLKHFTLNGAIYEVTEASYAQLEKMQEKYDEMYQSAYDSISGQMGLFDEFSTESTITTEEMLANLQTQIDGMNTWSEDMQTLADRGINQGLLETLRDMGPESYQYTHQLVTMTDEQLGQLNSLYEEKLTIQDSLAREMIDADGTLQMQMETMAQNAAKKAEMMRSVGTQTGQDLLEGLLSKAESIAASGSDIAEKFSRNLSDTFNERMNSLNSKKHPMWGSFVEEMIDAKSRIQGQMDSMVQSVAKTAETMQSVGEQIGQSFLGGFSSQKEDIITSGVNIVATLYDEITSKSLEKRIEYEAAVDKLNQMNNWQNLNVAKEAWLQTADAIVKSKEATDENADALSFETTMLEAEEAAQTAFAEAVKSVSEKVEAEKEAIEELRLEHFDYKGTTYEVTEASYAQLEKMQEKYDEMYQSAYDSISGQMGLFDEFSTESTITTEEMLANLQTQIDGMNTWSEDMQTLADRGINRGLLETLRDMGPESYQYTHQLVTMTDEQLGQLNSLYEEKLTIQDSLTREMIDADGTLQKQMETMIQNAARKAQAMRTVGEQAGQGFLEGLESKAQIVTALGASMAGSLIESVRAKLDMHSPSKIMEKLGLYTGTGFEKGAVKAFKEANAAIERELEKLASVDTSIPDISFGGASLNNYSPENGGAFGRVLELLTVIANKSSNIYLDSGELVGSLRDEIDSGLGDLQAVKAMGALR